MKNFLLLCYFSLSSSWALPPLQVLQQEADLVNFTDLVTESVLIDAPLLKVWDYLSSSHEAKNWSIFFHHISPLNDLDGKVGGVRRCYRYENEKGFRWDELTIYSDVQEGKRVIVMYNVKGHPLPFVTRATYTFVWQHYKKMSDYKTLLTFSTMISAKANSMSKNIFNRQSETTKKIFKYNLENIAQNLVGKPSLISYQESSKLWRRGTF
jgi:uncharacterized protein YndB with AHSA1/START domain